MISRLHPTHPNGRCHSPVDISDVEDLTVGTVDVWVGPREFDVDRYPAKVGAHGEVSNGRCPSDSRGDIKEDAVCPRLHGRCSDDAQRCKTHDRTDGEIHVGAMLGYGDGNGTVVHDVGVDGCRDIHHG